MIPRSHSLPLGLGNLPYDKKIGVKISHPTLERKLDVLCPGFERETVANSILGKAQKGHTILYFIKDSEFDPKDISQTIENIISHLEEVFGTFDLFPVRKYLISCCERKK